MKIVILFPRFGIGGVSKSLAFVANAYAREGHEVIAISMSEEEQTVRLLPSITKEYIVLPSGSTRMQSVLYKLRWAIAFRSKIRQCNPDWIVVFRPDLVRAVFLSLLAWRKKPKILASERGNPTSYGNRLFTYKRYYNKCNVVVFQTPIVETFYNLSTTSVVIPNPFITRSSRVVRKSALGRNIISVGRLSHEKNFEGLIRAYALCQQELPSDTKLIIYGEGDLRGTLEGLIQELGLTSHVLLPGNVVDFTSIEDDSGLFVLNSYSEGMPNALIEAMIVGLPAIATDCPAGGVSWLSDGGRRVRLVPVDNPEALAFAIVEVMKNSSIQRRLVEASRELEIILDSDKIENKWLNIIQ